MVFLLRNISINRIGLMVALTCVVLTMQATHRALIIGIGDYPEANGWCKINGDKDIFMVEQTLLANGFEKSHMIELKNEEATYEAICQAFENLISQASVGDVIYVHFSCHGQQITDLNGDEEDGWDEAIVPYDAKRLFEKNVYEGEKHLVDDQINLYLHRLRERLGDNGKIIVVADACHSGDGTRKFDDNEVVIRGTCSKFEISHVKNTIKRWLSFIKENPSLKAGESSVMAHSPIPIEWIYISACKCSEFNSEYNGNGSLTAALYNERESLSSLPLDLLEKRILVFYQKHIYHPQNPTIEKPQKTETESLL